MRVLESSSSFRLASSRGFFLPTRDVFGHVENHFVRRVFTRGICRGSNLHIRSEYLDASIECHSTTLATRLFLDHRVLDLDLDLATHSTHSTRLATRRASHPG